MKALFLFNASILRYLYVSIDIVCLVVFILVIYIFYILIRKNRLFSKQKIIIRQLEEWLMEVVLEEPGKAGHAFAIPCKIKQLLKNKLAKKVLLQELVKLKKSLSGTPGNNVKKLYEQLHLDILSRQRISSNKWHYKVQGIQELAIMNQHAAGSHVLSLTNHRHPIVRMEAQTAMVRLKNFKGLNFLNTLSFPITEWHQMNLLQLLSNQPITPVHGIKNWLHSSNTSVVQFALKLIGEQHAEEFCDEVINCLDDFDINVRRCTIVCLGEILSVSASEALKKHFDNEESKELRLSIIDQLKKTGMESEIKFFMTLQLNEDEDIKLASHNTILHLLKNKKSFAAA